LCKGKKGDAWACKQIKFWQLALLKLLADSGSQLALSQRLYNVVSFQAGRWVAEELSLFWRWRVSFGPISVMELFA